MRVKICGVCSGADAALALAAGADHVGVIVMAPGPRAQGIDGAARVLAAVPPAARVGVFVDVPPAEVIAAARALELGVVQLHGSESPAAAAVVRHGAAAAVWKVVHAVTAADLETAALAWRGVADGLLLDSGTVRQSGGTGQRFDWDAVAPARDAAAGFTLVVAGGLNADNVAAAVACFRPDVVDVSSGVEASVCRKSAARVHGFVAAARAAAATAAADAAAEERAGPA
jgi:phosphoribosylanthranilate isomerase